MPEHTAPVPSSTDLDGRVLAGRYRLGDVIASGGMAQVRRGTDEVLGRDVAVKILHPHLAEEAVVVDRFRREAVAAARLTDPSIVAIYDTVVDQGLNAIVMEMVHGMTLREFLDQRGPLDPQDAIDVAAGVAQALQVAHEAGIVHRDIKPANILLCEDRRVKVADFGIAKATVTSDLTETGTMIGTAKYLAPEQVEGERVDPRTDIYALGVVLYECLTGKVPFEADTDAATALARLHRDPLRPRQIRPSVPRDLDALTMQALARDPAGRPSTASSFRALLLGVASSDDAPPPGADHTIVAPLAAAAAEPDAYVRSERRWLVPTALVVVVGLALALAGVLIGRTETGQQIFTRARELVTPGDSGSTAEPRTITIAEAASFDPIGGDGEEDGRLPGAVDGNPDTAWRTEFYNVGTWSRKGGVGLVVVLDGTAQLDELRVTSPSHGWSAQVHLAPEAVGPGLDAWGDAVAGHQDIEPGTVTFDLDGREAGAVLVWFTALDESRVDALHVEVSDVTVVGR